MKINKGVEWAVHAMSVLAVLPEGRAVSAEALAAYHETSATYMAKQLQALSKAGLVRGGRGAAGGYRLTRPAHEITLADIFTAIEGAQPAFQCTELRQNGPCAMPAEDCKKPCGIAARFYAAERAFRAALAETTLTDILIEAAQQSRPEKALALAAWIETHAV